MVVVAVRVAAVTQDRQEIAATVSLPTVVANFATPSRSSAVDRSTSSGPLSMTTSTSSDSLLRPTSSAAPFTLSWKPRRLTSPSLARPCAGPSRRYPRTLDGPARPARRSGTDVSSA